MKELIWKFELRPTDGIITVELPQAAEVLSASAIGQQMFIWVRFSADVKNLEPVPRYFEVFGTGHEIHCDMGISRQFIGTAFMYKGALVWHIFERLN